MISEYLDRDYVLGEMRRQREKNAALLRRVKDHDPAALALIEKHQITPEQLEFVVQKLTDGLEEVEPETQHPSSAAFIPHSVVTSAFQSGLTDFAMSQGRVEHAPRAAAILAKVAATTQESIPSAPVEDASPPMRLAAVARPGGEEGLLADPFVEGDDLRYGLDGFWAKLGGLFVHRHGFNSSPAKVATSAKPLRVFIFGDWGTGLPLAQQVTAQIKQQLFTADGSRQQHVVHLGDVYYTGEPKEYMERMLTPTLWPVRPDQSGAIGSWSLNGNHDMYSGGRGFFETLLRDARFLRWHADANGQPSSFFLIEDANWQIFGLDTSWNLPSLAQVAGTDATIKDYGGQNGILTQSQVDWMGKARNPAKGLVLLSHHQPASSRTTEGQHSKEAIALLQAAGLYGKLDAWIWGHEHRGVVFKPKAQRSDPVLKEAPEFCACIGHGGVPVPAKNFEAGAKKADVLWEENRLDASAPMYGSERAVPFGFARLELNSDRIDFRMFDHRGEERFISTIVRTASR